MSLAGHLAVVVLLVIDLVFGSFAVERFSTHSAAVGFEFAIILGYVLFVLQWWPWKRPDGPSGGTR